MWRFSVMRKPNPILTTGAQHKSDKDAGSDDRCLKVIECLEGLALDILEQMVASIIKPNNLTPHTTNAHGLAPFNNARYGRLEVTVSDRSKGGLDESRRVLRYPVRGSRTSSKHIAHLLKIMSYAHRALEQGISLTKRDIYYKDVALFKSQKIVDRFIDDLAATLQWDRADLNIRATSKGLICGSCLVIRLIGGASLHLNDHQGTLIPAGEDIGQFEFESRVAWVLIVEKEVISIYLKLPALKHHSFEGNFSDTLPIEFLKVPRPSWSRLNCNGEGLSGRRNPPSSQDALRQPPPMCPHRCSSGRRSIWSRHTVGV